MRAIKTIAFRDLKSILCSPMYFMIIGVCAIIWSFNFVKRTIDYSHVSMSPKAFDERVYSFFDVVVVNHISTINLVLIFAIPALTMKLLAEEKKMNTIDLLLTSPVNSTQIIVGKYLAGMILSAVLVFISYIYPLASLTFISIDLGLLVSSFLALLFLSSAYTAIGLFASSISSSLILSLVVAVVLNLLLWLTSQGSLYSDGSLLLKVLDHLSIGNNLFAMVKGLVSFSSVAYFVSLIGLFVFMSQKLIDANRWR